MSAEPAPKSVPKHQEAIDKVGVPTTLKWPLGSQPSSLNNHIMDFQRKLVGRSQFFYFHVPTMSRVDICTMSAGLEPSEENMNRGLRNNSYKFLTPETESSTHFFWLHLRNYRVGDREWTDKMRVNLEKTFLEDREIEMAMQRSQNELGVRQLTGLQIDRGPGMALRMIEKLIQAEQDT